MKRPNPFLLSLISAAVTSTLMLVASPAQAQGGFYAARPATAVDAGRVIVRDTMWKCGADGCVAAAKGKSRPAIVCESLVKEIGRVDSFRAGEESFDAAALEKCNSKA